MTEKKTETKKAHEKKTPAKKAPEKKVAVKTETKAAIAAKLTPEQEALKKEIVGKVSRHFGKVMEDATPRMIYTACALSARDQIMEMWAKSHKTVKEEGSKKLYYLSFEFLWDVCLLQISLILCRQKTTKQCSKTLAIH